MRGRQWTQDGGALEGLPLYLLILVVVAGLGTAVVVGVFGRIDTCDEVVATVEVFNSGGTELLRFLPHDDATSLVVKARDPCDNFISGFVVDFRGAGVDGAEVTDDDELSTTLDVPALPEGQNTGEIILVVSKTDYQSGQTSIPVLRQ